MLKQSFDVGGLLRRELRQAQPLQPRRRQFRLQFLQQAVILRGNHRVHRRTDGVQLFAGAQARRILFGSPLRGELLQAADADHAEFVKIRTGDREKLEPAQQRTLRIARLIQHPLVEAQPAQFAVEIKVRFFAHTLAVLIPALENRGVCFPKV